MKTNNILVFAGIILISLAVPMLAAAAIQPNDYIAWVFPVQNFEIKGENLLDIEYPVGYIPVQGGATYTYTRTSLVTEINLTQPAQINSRMKTTIVDYAISKGYNIKKIVYQDYNVANP